MKTIKILLLVIAAAFSGCTHSITKQEAFPDMYAEHPKSIVVLPPINATTETNAAECYTTTVAEFLTPCGYYVYPMDIVFDVLHKEDMFNKLTHKNIPPRKFKELFGADAIMLIRLQKWDRTYLVLGGYVTVALEAELISTTTGKVLWYNNAEVNFNTSGTSGGAPGLAGAFVAAATTAAKTFLQEYIPVAKRTNEEVFKSIPFGEYCQWYLKDQSVGVDKRPYVESIY